MQCGRAVHCCRDSQCFQWARQPQNSPFPWRYLDPISYIVPWDNVSHPQTASWSLQPFLKCAWTLPTERQTDRPRYYICSNRQHLATAAMRPKNDKFTFESHNQWTEISELHMNFRQRGKRILISQLQICYRQCEMPVLNDTASCKPDDCRCDWCRDAGVPQTRTETHQLLHDIWCHPDTSDQPGDSVHTGTSELHSCIHSQCTKLHKTWLGSSSSSFISTLKRTQWQYTCNK